jgi:hypothetical protein
LYACPLQPLSSSYLLRELKKSETNMSTENNQSHLTSFSIYAIGIIQL